MSELITPSVGVREFHGRFLATVCSLALSVYLSTLYEACAIETNADRPTVWIELGGNLERLSGGQQAFSPPFSPALDADHFVPFSTIQSAPRFSVGGQGRLSFAPKSTKWLFSASVRYGRSNRAGQQHEETQPASPILFYSIPAFDFYLRRAVPPKAKKFISAASQDAENHAVVDFQVGRDVGVGMIGAHGVSEFDLGIRFAQFTSKSVGTINANPDFGVTYFHRTRFGSYPGNGETPEQKWHLVASQDNATRNFRGIGPSVAWDQSIAFVGDTSDGLVTLDWGANAALLFGRQKTKVHHQTSEHYVSANQTAGGPMPVYQRSYNPMRVRSVIVPNIGGFAGFSFKFPNAKLSLGYRADFFFSAIDGGIDTRKTYDRSFYGPFATISVGLP